MDHMNLSDNSMSVITLFAEDMPRTKSFYQEVFGLQVLFDSENQAVFKFQNLVVNLTDASDPLALIAPAAVASRQAGPRFQLVIEVDDVDAACAELARHGVTLLNGPQDRPWGVRTASFSDPAGHIWEVAQDLD
jgi:catechol 2,3-dioxygenase-like lactoylglutathione lyase family enzyme